MSDSLHSGRSPEDAGTVLESLEQIRAAYGDRDARTAVERFPAAVGVHRPASKEKLSVGDNAFTPMLRPPTPRLTLLDDGETSRGETVRLRDPVTVIGRTEGQVTLPHDTMVSSKHAEIVREGKTPPHKWILRDLGSSNGTFVGCAKTVLSPDRILVLGARRFRFKPAIGPAGPTPQTESTELYDARRLLTDCAPSLVETTAGDSPAEIRLQKPNLRVGRPGYGNDIELEDSFIANHHARISQDSSGQWVLEALPSKNGVWVQVTSIKLSGFCRFLCGEQRFLFVL
jgi:pSer/pThr/pTyr-binding forkhead associated (FHA) protein